MGEIPVFKQRDRQQIRIKLENVKIFLEKTEILGYNDVRNGGH